MTRRTLVKWLHWLAFGLMLWFFFMEPDVPDKAGRVASAEALSTHAGMGMVLGSISAVWVALWLFAGPLGRPGPKLPDWGRRAHRILNTGLFWLLPLTVLSGAAAGLASEYPVTGFGAIPLNPAGWGAKWLHEAMAEVHEFVFDAATLAIIVHAGFHAWRHYMLRDNALRIMFPQRLHRYL